MIESAGWLTHVAQVRDGPRTLRPGLIPARGRLVALVVCLAGWCAGCAHHVPGPGAILSGVPQATILHTTGYSFQDNTPSDSNGISCGIIHEGAGGAGSYADPITVAVPGHVGEWIETPCGTRFYIPRYRKYFLVEDTGATPYNDAHHIDIWVGGQGGHAYNARKCMVAVTTPDTGPGVPAAINPPPGLPVIPGPITPPSGNCNVGHTATNSQRPVPSAGGPREGIPQR